MRSLSQQLNLKSNFHSAMKGKVQVTYFEQGNPLKPENFTGKTVDEAKVRAFAAAQKFCSDSLFQRVAIVRLVKNDGFIMKFESKNNFNGS